jgi:hypothetical protein
MFTVDRARLAAGVVVLLALLIMPAPLLPPHRLAQALQTSLGLGWNAAYLAAALGLHIAFYSSLGVLAALAAGPAPTMQGRLRQILVLPFAVVGAAVMIRSAKLGHLPMLANAIIPIAACLFGATLGIGLLYKGWKLILPVATLLTGAALWGLLGGVSTEFSRETEMRLAGLAAAGPDLPTGDARFGAMLQTAFAPQSRTDAVQQNRAAILALGIALGHERLALFAGLHPDDELVQAASLLRQGATLRGREDWPRHYAVSAALAALEIPLLSDTAGLLKEELDALTLGSGFSFGDLAADRAGTRFANAAIHSAAAATAMQLRLQRGFAPDDFFPPAADLPENLTVGQFRDLYGSVGSQHYRQKVREIEARLDGCAAIAPSP